MDGFSRDPSRARRRYGKTLHVTTQPLFASYRLSWLLVAAAPLVLANCSSNNDNPGGNGGSTASGGAASGGAPASGGTSSGGAASGGAANGGAPGSGGAASGGATGSGGASSGGAASGGAPASGGSANGGSSNGGSSNGGHTANSGGGGGVPIGGGAGAAGTAGAGGGSSGSFTLTSPNHMEGAKFAEKYTCASSGGTLMTGANPELDWSGAPAGTMSFAITFIDTTLGESSPLGQHWAIWNIPASVMKFPEATTSLSGDLASAKQSGKFFAPCAQSLMNGMDDQYAFTIYALSTATLNVSGTSVANVLTALKSATPLATAKLTGHAGMKGK